MNTGKAETRREAIMERLRDAGFLSVGDIARELAVSEMTIRRDLRLLEQTEPVQLVHGGVSLARPAAFGARAQAEAEAKRRIARQALAWVAEDDVIALDAGTTTFELARALPSDFAGCVVTHSVPVLQLLLKRAAVRVIALGGDLFRPSQAFAGPATAEAAARVRVRTFFLGAAAIDARGVYVAADVERITKLMLRDVADRVVLVADHSKFGRAAPVILCGFAGIAALVTDAPPPDAVAAALRVHGVQVETAGP
jgi:DeoR/GlpR family transcriptional regulator of sugar metabolism